MGHSTTAQRTRNSPKSFDHVTSSPHFPQSNGLAERSIQTVKRTLTKAKQAGVSGDMALMCLRSTPIDHSLPSPAELLYQRKIRGNLPVRIHNKDQTKDRVMIQLQHKQQKQLEYHDRHSKPLQPVSPGQNVMIQDQGTKKWSPAIVTNTTPEPRSYEVMTDKGGILRRNRHHIRPTQARVTFDIPQSGNKDMSRELTSSDLQAPTVEPKNAPSIPLRSPGQPAPRRSSRMTAPPEKLDL